MRSTIDFSMKYTKLTVGILSVVILVTAVSFLVLNRDAAAPADLQDTTQLKAPDIAPVATSRVAIQSYQLMPQAITIEKGTTVIWTNADSISQELVFHFDNGEQTSGMLAPGASYSRSFDKVRTVLYTVRSNPNEVGAIIVNP
jgi:plastocyanin